VMPEEILMRRRLLAADEMGPGQAAAVVLRLDENKSVRPRERLPRRGCCSVGWSLAWGADIMIIKNKRYGLKVSWTVGY
jgi:hypothetical protein